MRKRSKVYELSDEDFSKLISENTCYSDVLRALGLTPRGGTSSKALKKRIEELGIDTSHFKGRYGSHSSKYSLSEILVENSSYTNIPRLKIRLVNEGYMEYKCATCGISEWNGRQIVLQLDHINGVNNDNRLENIRLLCPNCHSQTDTYCGKNIKNIDFTRAKGEMSNGTH